MPIQKSLPLAFVALATVATAAVRAEDVDVFERYKTLAAELAGASRLEDADVNDLNAKTDVLIADGVEIMKLYAAANPNCAEQYEQIFAEQAGILAMELGTADERYHDGKGLPVAPRHCYFGRSLIVHPLMNQIRFKEGVTADEREAIVDEFQEVVGHVARAKKNIENPPN